MSQQFSQYIEKTTNKIQDLLEQVHDVDDIAKAREIYDEVASQADKAAAQLSKINDMLNGQGDDENNEMNETLQKSAKESNRGSREKEKVGSR